MEQLDWRTGDGYPDHGNDTAAWAWEFLRRNPDYRSDWAEVLEISGVLRKKYGRKAEDDHCDLLGVFELAWLHEDEAASAYSPPKLSGESTDSWLRRVQNGQSQVLTIALGEKWGLKTIADPNSPPGFPYIDWSISPNRVIAVGFAVEAERRFVFDQAQLMQSVINSTATCAEKMPRLNQAIDTLLAYFARPNRNTRKMGTVQFSMQELELIRFDLSLPIDEQLKQAKRVLESRQEGFKKDGGLVYKGRKEIRMYQGYLRILDALAENGCEGGMERGQKHEIATEIAKLPRDHRIVRNHDEENMANSIKTIREQIEVAREIRDGGYLKLVALNEVGVRKIKK